jgi:hypothetical protein
VPGLGEVNVEPADNAVASVGSELGTVPWPPLNLLCCEAFGAVYVPIVLFGRHSTLSSELARTRGIRLSN